MAERADDDQKKLASKRVADSLRSEIESGRYPPGAPLPAYRHLAREHGVAVNTAMAAVRLLRDEGWVTSKPNAGAFVRDRSQNQSTAEEVRSLRVELANLQAQVRSASDSLDDVQLRLAEVSDRLADLES